MNGNLGKGYLKDYIVSAKPLLTVFFEEAKKNVISQNLGDISLDLVTDLGNLTTEGKGIRGALTKLTYKACGGQDEERILKTSTFIEIFHTAILVQDDFMDRDPFRRGKKTIFKTYSERASDLGIKIPAEHYGNSLAVCVSDTGFYYSWKVLLESGFPDAVIIKAGLLYADIISRLGLGQALDMTITGNETAKDEDALKVLYLKTVEYTAILPMLIGATLAGESDGKRLNAIREYAKCFGWAFQIQDDILGLYAKEEELGKPVGSDIREGKNTLLMINFRKKATREQLEFQKSILGKNDVSVEDVDKMRSLLKDTGTYDDVLNLGWKYIEEGTKYIKDITVDSELAQILESLIYYMMERTK